MKNFSLVLTLLLVISLITIDGAFASPKPTPPIKKTNNEAEIYKYAEIQLDRQLYRAYRVAERIIRANKLDEYPWTIEIPNDKDYTVNASTAQGNLITLDCGTVDTFYNDVSALASTIGHEMAHEMLRHQYKKNRYNQVMVKNIESDINTPVESLDTAKNSSLITVPILITGANYLNRKKLQEEQNRLQDLVNQAKNDSLAYSRSCEYEADKLGLIYATKAGFDPKGSIREFEFYKRMGVPLEEDSDHPDPVNRIYQIKNTLKSLNTVKLKKEGLYNINHSRPLTYEKYFYKEKDAVRKKSIVINSKYYTEEVNEPFKKMFGK